MKFKFASKGKTLLYLAGAICILSLVLSPLGIILCFIARTAYIDINDRELTYKIIRKKTLPLASISKLTIAPMQQAHYQVDYTFVNFASILPLIIEYDNGKKLKLSLNYFEKSGDIIKLLADKTGKEVAIPEIFKPNKI